MYELGNEKFKTKKDMTNYFRDYKNLHDTGTVLSEPHHTTMFYLLQRHPEYEEWSYGNLELSDFEFKIISDSKWNTKGFSVCDGNRTWNFSYLTCIKGCNKDQNNKRKVNIAARGSIAQQINKYRDSQQLTCGKFKCSLNGEFYNRNDIHVDHNYNIITFIKLLSDFLESKKLNYNSVKLTVDEHEHHCFFPDIDNEWQEYHKKHAVLRCINRFDNLSGKRKILK